VNAHKQTSHVKVVNGGQGLVVMCCEVRLMYKITQTPASIVILHARRCVDCCAGMLWSVASPSVANSSCPIICL